LNLKFIKITKEEEYNFYISSRENIKDIQFLKVNRKINANSNQEFNTFVKKKKKKILFKYLVTF